MNAGWKSICSPALDELGVEVGVAAAVADVPLARGDDLERLLAALVEVGLALGGLGLAVEVARLAQRRDDRLARAERGLAGDRSANSCSPGLPASHSGVSAWIRPLRVMTDRVGSCSSRHHSTSVRSPKVQHIAMPAPLSISASGVRDHRDLDAEQR